MANHQREWQVFVENREAVLEALTRGECGGILPAARGFLDGFAEFLLEAGVMEAWEQFPDPRRRRSIPIFFFCNTLLYRPLFHLQRVTPIEHTLFRSPYILRQLGFNAMQIEQGFYHTPQGQHPFTAEALLECFAGCQAADFLVSQKEVLKRVMRYCPAQFRSALWVMDSISFRVSPGAHSPPFAFRACVLGIWQERVVWPMLWAFVTESENESVVGKRVFAAAEEVLGPGFAAHLLVDRGYLDGAWISDLYRKGTRVTLGVKEDMLVWEEMNNLTLLEDTVWTEVDPPRLHRASLPQREVTGFTDLQAEWRSCSVPLSGCLIRDTYPDRTVYQGLVTTASAAEATEILADNRQRWTLEEVFMTFTSYWAFDNLPPCRSGVAYAWVHFALLAFTLLGFYLQETDAADQFETWNKAPPPIPLPERELAVYAGPYFTLLLPSELVEIILTHVDAWQANRDPLLLALRLCEGGS